MNFLKEKLAQIYGVNVSCPIKFNVQGFQLMSKGFKREGPNTIYRSGYKTSNPQLLAKTMRVQAKNLNH